MGSRCGRSPAGPPVGFCEPPVLQMGQRIRPQTSNAGGRMEPRQGAMVGLGAGSATVPGLLGGRWR